MKKNIFCVLLAVLVAVLPVALLCSCNGCSSKTVSAPAAVQGTAEAQAKPAPAVEKETAPAAEEIAPEVQPAEVEAVPVAEETPAETVAEAVGEPKAEEESAFAEESAPASTTETEEPTEVASSEEPAEEPVVEKAPAQEASAEPEPAPAAAEPVAETAAPAAEPAVAAVAEEEVEEAEKSCGNHIITLGLSPWGWQHFHIDESGLDDKNSTYGLGGKIAYTYLFDSGFYVGAEAAYETYFIDHKDNFHDIMFFVDGGYNFGLGEKLGLYVGLGGGLELECYEGECSAVGLVKGDLGLGYSLTEHWIVGAGCDFIFGFPTKSDTNYMGFQIIPCITASYKF